MIRSSTVCELPMVTSSSVVSFFQFRRRPIFESLVFASDEDENQVVMLLFAVLGSLGSFSPALDSARAATRGACSSG